MSFLIISNRGGVHGLEQACAHDLEDVAAAVLDGDIVTPNSGTDHLKPRYDGALIARIGHSQTANSIKTQLPLLRDRIDGPILGYLFSAYAAPVQNTRHPFRRLLGPRRTPFTELDCLFLGIADDAEFIGHKLNVPIRYVPMAAHLHRAAAIPYMAPQDRPIAISAFGRQKYEIVRAFNDRFNTRSSEHVLYCTNFMNGSASKDLETYRRMFWHLLRRSRLSTAFDHFYTSPETAKSSYVGPRWFESLAAGTVVIGKAPTGADRARLLDWEDALIDLDDDPIAATDQTESLLADPAKLDAISRRNLWHMYHRHDWGHRLADMLTHAGLSIPESLQAHLQTLKEMASQLDVHREVLAPQAP